MKKSLLFAAVLLLAAQIPAYSQISLFSAAKRDGGKRGDAPTTINADAMDIDLICLDSGCLVGDLLKSRSVNGDAGIQLRMMVYIILHSL